MTEKRDNIFSSSDIPSEEELSRIRVEAMDFGNVGLYRYRFDGTIVFFDRGALRLLDLENAYDDPKDVCGLKIGTLFEYLDDVGRLRDAVREHGRVQRFEYHYRTLSGKERWVYHNSYLTRDSETDEEMIQVIAQDITELKRTTLALEASEARYRALADGSLQGLLVVGDEPPKVLYANLALADMLGTTVEKLTESTLEDLYEFLRPEDAEPARRRWRARAEGRPLAGAFDTRVIRADGEHRDLTVLASPTERDGKEVVQVTVIDQTERVKAAEQRRELEEQALRSRKLESLGLLAGGIAHDFNNMLAGILGHADLARLEADEESELYHHLEAIMTTSENAADLCRQLLGYTGRRVGKMETHDIDALVLETTTLIEVSLSKKVTIERDLGRSDLVFEGDSGQLRQVIMNLVTNASDAIGDRPGHVRVVTAPIHLAGDRLNRLHLGSDLEEGDYIKVEVSDDGHGMEEEMIERIFDPFFSTKSRGRGLGLATVHGIVRAHQGAVEVESTPGRGTTFRVFLPQSEKARCDTKVRSCTPALHWDRGSLALAVDDEEVVLEGVAQMLESFGFEVARARHGREALSALRELGSRVCVVVLDVKMPFLGGHEVYRELRALHAELPVVFSSGILPEALRHEIERDELATFVQKPFTMARLERALAKVAGQKT